MSDPEPPRNSSSLPLPEPGLQHQKGFQTPTSTRVFRATPKPSALRIDPASRTADHRAPHSLPLNRELARSPSHCTRPSCPLARAALRGQASTCARRDPASESASPYPAHPGPSCAPEPVHRFPALTDYPPPCHALKLPFRVSFLPPKIFPSTFLKKKEKEKKKKKHVLISST